MKTDKNTHQTPSGHPSQTELASTDNNQYYIVFSPDGILASYDVFQGKQEAEEFISKYCQEFAEQGYYKAVGRNIPLEELPKHMSIVSYCEYFSEVIKEDAKADAEWIRREKREMSKIEFWLKWGPIITFLSLLFAFSCLLWSVRHAR